MDIYQFDNEALSDNSTTVSISNIHERDDDHSTGLQDFTPIRDSILQSQVKYYSFNVNKTGVGESYQLIVFLTGNICSQPQGINPNETSLAVYYSFNSTMFTNNEIGQMKLFQSGYFQALAALEPSETTASAPKTQPVEQTVLYIAVRAPQNTNLTAEWTYQIGVSQNDLVFQWDETSAVSVVDADDTNVLLITRNLTVDTDDISSLNDSQVPYSVYVYPYEFKDYFAGINNSWCAVRNGPSIFGPGDYNTSYTNRTGGIHQQIFISGLNSSTKYIAYTINDNYGTEYGGSVFHPFEFETMESSPCQLIYDLEFCQSVAYSVPAPGNSTGPNRDKNATKWLYDSYAQDLYTNFSKALMQIACDTVPEAIFSNLKTCDDCADSYKDWLCSVSIPRCSTKNITGYKYRKDKEDHRNDFIRDVIQPDQPYYEVLPCIGVCNAIVRDCPAQFGFECPTKNESIALSYYWPRKGQANEQWPSCNRVGKMVVKIQSAGNKRMVINWVLLCLNVYGQQEIVDTVRKFVQTGKLPHLLFYGPPGTGKTSTIVALAREIYGSNYRNMVLELNASDDRGIDVVRNQIKNFASTRQIFSTNAFKLIILDEADAMTSVAQNSLRRIIEKFTKNCRFCILANYSHKLNPALISRCTRFRFHPIDEAAIKSRIENVITKEHVKIDNDALDALLKLSKGDMRRALNVLQACKSAIGVDNPHDSIDLDMIYECIGAPHPQDIETVLDSILKDDWTTAYITINKFKTVKGLALIDLIAGFIEILNNYKLKPKTRIEIFKNLSDIEYGISKGGNDKIQSSAIIGVIKNAMENEQ
ncbi:MID1 [[Candida] subhashii]|uniref:Replication factor C subunit 3 n=1 Tax=[Candida] subhashii TaxID=561895 RepID=A0A8J5V3V0_9ASCO|nr:MID1 [[Candida] subhashii]KAG7664804.1 MID1 [[Candida] subhashii]